MLTLTHTQLAASEVHAQAVQEELTSACEQLADHQALYATAKLDLEGVCQYLYVCTSKASKSSTCAARAMIVVKELNVTTSAATPAASIRFSSPQASVFVLQYQ